MRELKHPLKITHEEFERGLIEAADMDDESLMSETGGKPARSYFVRHDGRAISLKWVLRLAFKRAGKPWGELQSEMLPDSSAMNSTLYTSLISLND